MKKSENAEKEIEVPAPATPSEGFEERAARLVESLRRAVVTVLASGPGTEKPAALRKRLDLDAALAWQIHAVATADDFVRGGRNVPKPGSMERFVRGARRAGVPENVLDAVDRAYEQFARFIEEEADDRETFDSMLLALRPSDGAALERNRRSAFRANVAIWGLSVRCAVNCAVFRRRPSGEFDGLSIRAKLGVRATSPGAAVAFSASSRTWGGEGPPPEGARNVSVDGCRIIERYSSTPLPRIERRRLADSTEREFLALRGLGRRSEFSVYWTSESLNFPGGRETPPHGCTTACVEPAEHLIVALLVPRGWSDPTMSGERVTPPDSRSAAFAGSGGLEEFPFEGKTQHLGGDLSALECIEAPTLAEVVGAELQQRGWDDTVFDIYRLVVRYPVLHSLVHVFADGRRSAS